jgi:endoglucanase
MKSRKIIMFLVCLLLLSTALFAQKAPAGSPVARYGQLKVVGTRICDVKGNPVILKGMSTSGLQWYGDIINPDAFTCFAKDWKMDVIRLALYVGESGYASKPKLKDLVKKGIELAVANGLYVIVDWHVLTPGNPNDPIYAGAGDFFKEIAAQYGKTPNVIYEIMNEPNGSLGWTKDLKPYADTMVGIIRAIDPDNIILIGSGTWSQDVDSAAANPVAGDNLAYTVHFYAGTHGKILQRKIQKALDKGVAVYASEWGTSLANGDGGPFIDKSEEWLKFLDEKGIGWTNWSLCNRNETSAAFKKLQREYVEGKGTVTTQKETPMYPTEAVKGGYKIWPLDQLSVSGAYVRAKLRGEPIPTYETSIKTCDFEKGLEKWGVPGDSPVKAKVAVDRVESDALLFANKWPAAANADAWSTSVRLIISNAGIALPTDGTVSLDFYLQAGKKLKKGFEVVPVLQYPPSWWQQLSAVKIPYAKGVPAGKGWLKFTVKAPFTTEAGAKLGHLVLVVVGDGSGYDGQVAVDSIMIAGTATTEAAAAAVEPEMAEDLGSYQGLPWNFEDGTRQGWTVPADSAAKVKAEVRTAETKALAFTYGWTKPGPADPWNAAPRLSSSWVNLPADKYKTLSFDFYIEAGKAKSGSFKIQPVIQSAQHNYWFELTPQTVSAVKGMRLSNGLFKYNFTFTLTSAGKPFNPGDVMRNLILVTVGIDTDYDGAVFYDNITFK